MSQKYIGERKVKSHKKTTETTPGGTPIIKVDYDTGLSEHLSEIMFNETISNEKCNATDLRAKRVKPVMQQVLMILREWGIKDSEFAYFSQLLNDQLDFNRDNAYIRLISQYMPTPLSLAEVDMLTLDRVLKDDSLKTKS